MPRDAHVAVAAVNGEPAAIFRSGERALLVLTIELEAGRVRTVRIVANPDKLAHV